MSDELDQAVKAAREAADGDSNDDEIRLLKEAMDLALAERELTNEEWRAIGLAKGWVGPAICIPHDGYPTSGAEDAEGAEDDCWHVLRLYPDEETKLAVEANHEPSNWRKP